MKIKKGDEVKIVVGKDKNKSARVIKVFPDANAVLVEGLNMFKKHMRSRQADKKGEVVLVPKPLSVSRIRLVCPSCRKATRVGYRLEPTGKIRVCKKCNKAI